LWRLGRKESENEVVEDKTLDIILSKIEELNTKVDSLDSKVDGLDTKVNSLDSKVDGLDTKVDSLDSKVDGLDTRVNNLEDNLSGFRNEFNEFKDKTNSTLERIEHRADATFEQVGMLSEFRTDIISGIDDLKNNLN
jgi:outer membrane murein-binding lipoprotein Lpp